MDKNQNKPGQLPGTKQPASPNPNQSQRNTVKGDKNLEAQDNTQYRKADPSDNEDDFFDEEE